MDDLTDRQKEVLRFIAGYIQQKHYPPTIRDIGKGFGISSPTGITCHLKALEKKGYIRRDHATALGRVSSRCLVVLKQPDEKPPSRPMAIGPGGG